MLWAVAFVDSKMLVIFFIFACTVCTSGTGDQNFTTFLEWYKKAINDEVPRLEVIDFENKRYHIESILTANYFQAMQFCNFHRMRLLTITSQKENKFLENKLKELGMAKFHYWTSGTVLPSNTHWIWMSSGRPIAYTNWDEGEPNRSDPKREACLEMRIIHHGLKWNDLDCYVNLFFICETSSFNIYNSLMNKHDANSSYTIPIMDAGSDLVEPAVQ